MKAGAPHEREAARRRLIECNLRLVWKNALFFYRQQPVSLALDDLFQEGCIGLVRATDKFDPQRNCRFSTCAMPWIRQAIRHALESHDSPIRLPAHIHENRRAAGNVALQLTDALGHVPSRWEFVGHVPDRLRPSVLAPWEVISLDTPLYGEAETLADLLPDSPRSYEYINSNAAHNELRAQIEGLLEQLAPRSARVLSLRYGLCGETEHNYREIGQILDLHPESVRQIEKAAVKRLSHSPSLREWVEADHA